jgi:hypothetical protein
MATAVVPRRPLLAARVAPRPAGLHLRRRQTPPRLLSVSSDSSKPVASTSSPSVGGDSPDEDPPVLPLLQELSVSRCVPSAYVVHCYKTIHGFLSCFAVLSRVRIVCFFRPNSSPSSPATFVLM